MKCREAAPLIADWVAGKLKPGVGPRMQEHLAVCERCRAEATAESRMRDLLGTFESAELQRDLAQDAITRAVALCKPNRLWAPRRSPAFAFAFAGVACAVVFWALVPRRITPVPAALDEGRMVRMVADMQQVPDASEDSLLAGGLSHYPWLKSQDSGGD
jgi:hypothetical protein